jgi:hypothetical protein
MRRTLVLVAALSLAFAPAPLPRSREKADAEKVRLTCREMGGIWYSENATGAALYLMFDKKWGPWGVLVGFYGPPVYKECAEEPERLELSGGGLRVLLPAESALGTRVLYLRKVGETLSVEFTEGPYQGAYSMRRK